MSRYLGEHKVSHNEKLFHVGMFVRNHKICYPYNNRHRLIIERDWKVRMAERTSNSFEVFELKNLTSDTSLIKKSKQVDVVFCDSTSVTFQSPKFSGSVGQLISLRGWLKMHGKDPIEFPVVGKITDFKNVGVDEIQIAIKLNQYDKKIWEQFIGVLKSKQSRIDNLLNSMKGEE